MDPQPYLELFRRKMWVIIITCLVTVAVVGLGSQRMTRIYSAASLVRVAQPQIDAVNYNDLTYTTRLIQTYAQLLKGRPFLDEVIKRLHLSIDLISLGKAVKVEPIANTELIRITVESPDPSQAAAIANTLGAILVEQGQQMQTGKGKSARDILQEQVFVIEQQLAADRAQYAIAVAAQPDTSTTVESFTQNLAAKIRAEEQSYALLLGEYDKARVSEALKLNSVSVVEPAVIPVAPAKPNLKLNLALGLLVGLLGGLGLAFLLDRLDRTIHTVDQVATKLGARFLARIPDLPQGSPTGPENYLLASDQPGPAAEAFMMLTASILSRAAEHLPRRALVVTSAEPGAGKSTVVVNLAAMLAQAGKTVIVVDGDLRSPSLHRALGLPRAPGLSDAMIDRHCLSDAVYQTRIPGLWAMPAGSPQANPARLWQTSPIAELTALLALEADIVLWDTPPILAASDALFLAPTTKAVLFVVARDQSRLGQVEIALSQLKQVGSEPVGIVYNRADGEDWGYYDYYHRRAKSEPRPPAAYYDSFGRRAESVARQLTALLRSARRVPLAAAAEAAEPLAAAAPGDESRVAPAAGDEPVAAAAAGAEPVAAAAAGEEPLATAAAGDEHLLAAAAGDEPLAAVAAGDEHIVAAAEAAEPLVVAAPGDEPSVVTASGDERFAAAASGDEHLVAAASGEEPLAAAAAGDEHLATAAEAGKPLLAAAPGDEPSEVTASAAEPLAAAAVGDEPSVVTAAGDERLLAVAAGEEPLAAAPVGSRQRARRPDTGLSRSRKR